MKIKKTHNNLLIILMQSRTKKNTIRTLGNTLRKMVDAVLAASKTFLLQKKALQRLGVPRRFSWDLI